VSSIIDFYRLQETDDLYLFWMKELLVSISIFAIFWVMSRLLRYLLTTWGSRLTSFTKSDIDDRILARIIPPATLLVVFAGLYYAVDYLTLPAKVHLALSGATFVIVVAIFTNIAYRANDEILSWYASFLVQKHGEGLDKQVIPLLEKLITIFLVGTALIITFKHFNYDILSLVTALGIGSLAIGLAAKDTLANMISGFTLMIDRPFRIGDRVHLSAGQGGDVVDIGLRTTKIKTVENTFLIVPNAELCNSLLVNQSFPDLRVKSRINVGVSYGTDVELAKRVLQEVALAVPDVLRDPPPDSFFTSFGDSALNLALFFWVEDYTRVFPVTDAINTRINHQFKNNGIVIPFPTRTVMLEKEQ
jgi:MscS family membrane protein